MNSGTSSVVLAVEAASSRGGSFNGLTVTVNWRLKDWFVVPPSVTVTVSVTVSVTASVTVSVTVSVSVGRVRFRCVSESGCRSPARRPTIGSSREAVGEGADPVGERTRRGELGVVEVAPKKYSNSVQRLRGGPPGGGGAPGARRPGSLCWVSQCGGAGGRVLRVRRRLTMEAPLTDFEKGQLDMVLRLGCNRITASKYPSV